MVRINAVFNELKFIIGAIPDTYIKLLQVYFLLKCICSINSDVFWQSIISLRRIEEVSAGMRNAGDILCSFPYYLPVFAHGGSQPRSSDREAIAGNRFPILQRHLATKSLSVQCFTVRRTNAAVQVCPRGPDPEIPAGRAVPHLWEARVWEDSAPSRYVVEFHSIILR
jgi:hypothetical protein